MGKRTGKSKRLRRRIRELEQRIAQLRLELERRLNDPLVQHHMRKR